ncbi:MAG: malectin, partial [Bifidobacteriaceae bacterium]|nr:malectin [Bifidobacteriaceae bacterium]
MKHNRFVAWLAGTALAIGMVGGGLPQLDAAQALPAGESLFGWTWAPHRDAATAGGNTERLWANLASHTSHVKFSSAGNYIKFNAVPFGATAPTSLQLLVRGGGNNMTFTVLAADAGADKSTAVELGNALLTFANTEHAPMRVLTIDLTQNLDTLTGDKDIYLECVSGSDAKVSYVQLLPNGRTSGYELFRLIYYAEGINLGNMAAGTALTTFSSTLADAKTLLASDYTEAGLAAMITSLKSAIGGLESTATTLAAMPLTIDVGATTPADSLAADQAYTTTSGYGYTGEGQTYSTATTITGDGADLYPSAMKTTRLLGSGSSSPKAVQYQFDVDPGFYTVKLYFSENVNASQDRSWWINVNGDEKADSYNARTAGGGQYKGSSQTYTDVDASGGWINVLTGALPLAVVEITQQAPPTPADPNTIYVNAATGSDT